MNYLYKYKAPFTYPNGCYCSLHVVRPPARPSAHSGRRDTSAKQKRRQMRTTEGERQADRQRGGRGGAQASEPAAVAPSSDGGGSEGASVQAKAVLPLPFSSLSPFAEAGRQCTQPPSIHPSRYVECDARLKRTKERTTFFGRPLLNSSARGIYRIFCCEIINISSTHVETRCH